MDVWWERLRQQEEQEEGQEEAAAPLGLCRRRRGDGPLPLGPVAERRVAAGDAHGVQPPGAELLVARGGDEARPRRGTRLPVVDSCKEETGNCDSLSFSSEPPPYCCCLLCYSSCSIIYEGFLLCYLSCVFV